METKSCSFTKTCLFPSATCTEEDAANCSEAQKRQIWAEKPCPLMLGRAGEKTECDIPQLRVFLPADRNCCQDGKCLIRKISPQMAGKVAGTNGIDGPKVSDDSLKEIGREIIKTMGLKLTAMV
jgi:hypothetical protein